MRVRGQPAAPARESLAGAAGWQRNNRPSWKTTTPPGGVALFGKLSFKRDRKA